jgi:hypothetical protein
MAKARDSSECGETIVQLYNATGLRCRFMEMALSNAGLELSAQVPLVSISDTERLNAYCNNYPGPIVYGCLINRRFPCSAFSIPRSSSRKP